MIFKAIVLGADILFAIMFLCNSCKSQNAQIVRSSLIWSVVLLLNAAIIWNAR